MRVLVSFVLLSVPLWACGAALTELAEATEQEQRSRYNRYAVEQSESKSLRFC